MTKLIPVVDGDAACRDALRDVISKPFDVRDVLARIWRVWPEVPQRHATVGVWVHRLRARIERDAAVPELIRTVRAQGYVFRPVPGDSVREVSRTLRMAAQPAVGTMLAYVR